MRNARIAKRMVGLAVAVGLIAFGLAGVARAQDKIVLRGITPWDLSYYWCAPFSMFQKMVNQRFKGRVTVSYLGANEFRAESP